MVKRFLTFALSVGFFIWLPSAFADGSGILPLDAPATFRQTQATESSPLLTLRVDNIQVRADWEVTDADNVFTISAGVSPNEGVLRTTGDATDTHVATIYAVDKFDLLNPAYVNLTASAVITVVFDSGVRLPAPRLTAVAGDAGDRASLYTFVAEGGSEDNTYTYTYALVGGNGDGHFGLDTDSGELSLRADSQAGVYMLTVQVTDGGGVSVVAVATVELSAALMLANAPPISVALGAAVSLHTFIASGGIGVKNYGLSGGPTGYRSSFYVASGSGVLSLLASAETGEYTLRARAIDEGGREDSVRVTVRVSAMLSLADVSSLLVGAVRQASELHTFAAEGGIGARTYTLVAGEAAGYFSLGAKSGALSLLATAVAGMYTLSVQVKDEHDNMAQALATVDVRALYLANPGTLYAIEGRTVSLHTFVAKSGVGEKTYILVADKEEYFTLGTKNGVLSVLADAPIEIYTLSVLVEDTVSNTATAVAIVEVRGSLFLAAVPPLTVIVGRVAHTLVASGGIEDLTYAIVSGKDGFALDAANGVLSLHADAGLGRHILTLQVMDAREHNVQAVATVAVSAVLTLVDASPFTVIASVAMSLHTFVAGGGIGTHTYAIVSGNDKKAFILNAASGALSLSVNAEPDNYVLSVEVTDARGNTAEAVATVGVSAVLSLADAPRLTAVAGEAATLHMFGANGGIGIKTYTLAAGNKDYFSVDADSGVLSLRVSAQAGKYTLTVEVADDDRGSDAVAALATVEVSAALMLADAPLIYVALESTVSLHTFIASGGIGIKTYTLAAGNENYFSVDAGSGTLSLLDAAQEGVYTLTVQAMDADSRTVVAAATVRVSAALMLADAPSFTVLASVGISLHTFAADGGIGVKTYTLVTGAEYFSVGAASGVLSVNASVTVGMYTLSVRVEDADGNAVAAAAMVEVTLLFLLEVPPLYAIAEVATAVSVHTFAAVQGAVILTFTIFSGNDGRHFTLDPQSGVLSVQNASVAIYTLGVAGKDADNNRVEVTAVVDVDYALTLAAVSLAVQTGITAGFYTLSASGGGGVQIFTLAAAGNEAGYFALDAAAGVLQVSNAAVGAYTLLAGVSDDSGGSSQAKITVQVVQMSLADAPFLSAVARLPLTLFLHTFAAYEGIGKLRYTIIADGDESGYFAVDADSGVLSLPDNPDVVAGTYSLRVGVSDSLTPPQQATAVATVHIGKNGIFVLGGTRAGTYPNDVWASADGKNWFNLAATDFPRRAYYQAAVYQDKMYALGGFNGTSVGDAWSAVGGRNWTVEANPAWGARRYHQAVVYQERLYVLGGGDSSNKHYNDVWSWAAGESSWMAVTVSAAWDARQSHQALVHNGRMYVLGGGNVSSSPKFVRNDVWSSVDGVNWSFEGNADWPARAQHQAVSHNGRIYVLGGDNGDDLNNLRNDVWSWAGGGESWRREQANNNDFWSERRLFQAVSKDGRLYVMGGYDGVEKSDVWSSADGRIWDKVTDANWGIRAGLQAVVYPPNLTLPGTSETTILTLYAGLEIYPFSAQGGRAPYIYSLPPETEGFKIVNKDGTGVLSANNAQVPAGTYQVTVRVEDDEGSHAESIINIELRSFVLADAPPLLALARLSVAVSLHAFTGHHGVGAYTFDLVDESEDFILGEASGVLSVPANAAVGVYTVAVAASDERSNRATAVATVQIAKNGLFMLGGVVATVFFDDVWAAADGKNWMKMADAGWSERAWHQAVVYQGRLYVLGGYDGSANIEDMWSSADGKTWSLEAAPAWPKRQLHQAVAHQGRLYVLGGNDGSTRYNDVWSWAKGENWSLNKANDDNGWEARNGHQVVSHNSRLYVLGGYDGTDRLNDLWSSVDGANWSFEGNVEWTIRARHQAVSHNGRIYVLGGTSGNSLNSIRNDVWSWAEGDSGWREEKGNNNDFWSKRYSYKALSRDGLLYVMGGFDNSFLSQNDVWSSADGVIWEKVADANWDGREGLAAVIFPSHLTLPGTSETIALTLQAGLDLEIYTFRAQGGFGQYTYSLPPENKGFKIDGDTGVLSTDKDQVSGGSHQVTVRVEDEDGGSAQSIINIELPSFVLADAPPLLALGRLAVAVSLHAFTDSRHGVGASTYKLVNELGNFTLGEASGVLSVRANAAVGVYTVSVAGRDGISNRATAVATVRLAQNGIFMMGGDSFNDVWAAVDGKDWVKVADAGWTGRTYHQAVGYKGRLYVLGGSDSSSSYIKDMWSSADGKTWSLEATPGWSGRQLHQAVAHQGRLYVLGGLDDNDRLNDVWSWAKGESWSLNKANDGKEANDGKGWKARTGHQAVSHNGRLYVLSGDDGSARLNDVWSSVDGKDWSLEATTAWLGRQLHQAVSHQGRLYVLGGLDSGNNLPNDVWSWAEGESGWTPVKASNENFWRGRYSFKALSRDGLLYVMGGNEGGFSFQNDVWSSADGVIWTKVTNADWDARQGLQAVVFPPNLTLPGTSQTIALTLQVGLDVEIYTFIAQGGFGQYTYSLPSETEGFKIDGGTGVLSAVNGQASAGTYQVAVRVEDEDGSRAESIINIELRSFVLADVPPLFAIGRLAVAASVHAFTGQHGVGASTYKLVNESGNFNLGEASGVLEAQANVAVGVYTVSVEARDERSNQATAVATVRLAKNGIFVMGGSGGAFVYKDVWASADGNRWVKVADAGWGVRSWHQAVGYQGRLYVMGGYDTTQVLGDWWSSADGKTWDREANPAWTGRSQPQAVAHNGRLYVLGGTEGGDTGRRNDVWSWAEGESSWMTVTVSAAWTARNGHQAVAHAGRLYVMGGYDGSYKNDMWSSVDGANWSFEGTVAWSARTLHQAVSHNGRIYVLGGTDSNNNADGRKNDVWSWAEGESSWTEVKANISTSFWSQRASFQALSHDGLLYVMGGVSKNAVNDVWSSADGVSWTKVADAGWSIRQGLQALVYPPNLELSGTSETIALSLRAGLGLEIYTFSAHGGFGQYTYSLPPGTEGFNIAGGTGVLSANNDQLPAGVYQVTVWVEDEDGSRAESIINIELLYFYLADAPPLFALGRLSVAARLHTFTAVYGDGASTYNLVGDAGDFTLDDASGVLSVQANAALGVYMVSVAVRDAGSNRATVVATVGIIKNGIFVMGGEDGSLKNDVWSSVDGEIWRRDTSNVGWTPRQLHQAVAHNGRLYVMGGADGSKTKDVWSSGDGANWQREADAAWTARDIHQAVSYKGRIYVLGGADNDGKKNDVWSWADGETWSLVTVSANWTARDRYQAVVHNGRMYVLGGDGADGHKNDVWSSANGSSWRFEGNADWDARYFHQAVSHAGRLYVLGGSDRDASAQGGVKSDVWSSVDGRSWVREKDNNVFWSNRFRHQSLSRDGLLYVLGGSANGLRNDVWSSAYGRSWTKRTDAAWTARMFHQAVVFPPNLVLPGTSETITLSLRAEPRLELYTFRAKYGFGQYAYSLPPETEGFNINGGTGVLSANNDQVPAGAHQVVVRVEDEDGSRAESVINIELIYYDLADAPPLFAIGGLSVAVSLHVFTAVYGDGAYTYDLVDDDSGYFTLGAESGVLSMTANVPEGVYTVSVVVSEDGNRATAVATARIVKNGIFVLGGNESQSANNDLQNDVWLSADGESWRENTSNADWTAREFHQVVAYRGRMYLLGGVVATGKTSTENKNDVWSSLDGKNWSLVTGSADWTARGHHQALVHKGRMYVLGGGGKNDVWSSADGKNWEEETGSADWTLDLYRAVAHNGRMYVTGGYDKSDVWSSADGSSWRFEGEAAWGPRHFHQAVSHNGRLYVLGGIQGTDSYNRRNDVWSSSDGRIWVREKENNNDFWTKRDRFQALSRDGLLYVLGGNANGLRKDVWSSSDGKNWTEETGAAGWGAREYHQALVFPPED